ncbi:NmrA family NAD(P)-binding protein [Hoeflea sp. EC-HK425]|uniref:NmrA family NAD(P)-binding protein n=1 Tax=Hoeflea sp. EC-HK425 TaxID=2038388 RepID=UPI001256E7BB|nr:NmrA family NAD(P)-binding protein [Hoeflea sp. EC-HK425]VVT01036.1 putative nucleoside-diphosphate sugar epimerase [Hoeflea sp. EC-HK425]
MARRIFITGATGTVGGAVMRYLSQDPKTGSIELLGAARSEPAASKLRDAGHQPIHFDYDDPASHAPALEGVDAVFLSTGYSVDMIVHSKRLLNAARAAGVRHIVHLGALAPDDTPHAHFAWHQVIEHSIEAMGFDWTHLRPNFFMDTVWKGFAHRPDRLVHFIGDRKVSWISSDDMAAVAGEALKSSSGHTGQTYRLAVEALSFADVAAILTDITGTEVYYRPRPAADLLPILLKQGMDPAYAAGLAEGVAALEAGSQPLADAVYDTVAQVTGREPVSWREFAAQRLTSLSPRE